MLAIETIVNFVNTILWDYALLFLLCGTGIFFTFKLKFVQVRKFGAGMKKVFACFNLKGEKADKGGMSSFQALTTAIAAQVGTGNIAGAATAIASGGPGAIFWMWMSAFFGMATIYAEALLAQKYKSTDKDGNVTGGPVYYIKAAFSGKLGKALAGFFAVAIIFACGFIGSMVQSNSIASNISGVFTSLRALLNSLYDSRAEPASKNGVGYKCIFEYHSECLGNVLDINSENEQTACYV